MNAEIFAEWFKQRGYRLAQSASSYWVRIEARAYQSFPYHILIDPQEKELTAFLLRKGAVALRYSAPQDSVFGMESYHVVYEGKTMVLNH